MADDKKIIFSMVGVSKTYPPQKQVLKNIYLSFFYGAKIGIIGLNGSGKSSLLKIIAGIDNDYQGEVVFSPGYTVGYLEQDPKLDPDKTVIEVVREGVQPIMDLLAEYDRVNEGFGDPDVLEDPDKMDALINRQAEIQDKLDATDAWNIDSRLERAMDALQCPPDDQKVSTLSGGERRRVALCRLLLQQPDVLLLDEPTNHLDITSKEILETALNAYEGTVLYVSHDRYFINRTASRILELTHHEFINYIGNYDYYLEKKEILTPVSESSPGADEAEPSTQKLDWKQQKENQALIRKRENDLKKCEDKIQALETRSAALDEEMAKPEIATNSVKLQEIAVEKERIESELEELYSRWETLSEA